jgi:hypothetical protein
MAQATFTKTAITHSNSDANSGYFCGGFSSGGTNHNAQITFPAFNLGSATINSVTLYIPWNNTSAGIGWKAGAYHRITINGYVHDCWVENTPGTLAVGINGWSNTSPFVVDVRGRSDNSYGTSKGYTEDAYIVVDYTPNVAPSSGPSSCSVDKSVVNSGTNVMISWPSDAYDVNGNIAGYNIYRYDANGNYLNKVASCGGTSYSYSTSGLADGSKYKFKVAPYDTYGLEGPTSPFSGVLTINSAPSVPPSLDAEYGSTYYHNTIKFIWGASTDADNQAITYILEVKLYNTDGSVYQDWLLAYSDAGLSDVYTIPTGMPGGGIISARIHTKDALGKESAPRTIAYNCYKDRAPQPVILSEPSSTLMSSQTIHFAWVDSGTPYVSPLTYEFEWREFANGVWGTWDTSKFAAISDQYLDVLIERAATAVSVTEKFQLGVRSKDKFGNVSDYALSQQVINNHVPGQPTCDYPTGIVYSLSPAILLTAPSDYEGHDQDIYSLVDNDAGGYIKQFDNIVAGSKYLFGINATTYITHNLKLKSVDALDASSAIMSRDIPVSQLVLIDPTEFIIANCINQIRNAINTVRNSYGLSNYSYTHTITPIATAFVPTYYNDIIETRAAINELNMRVKGWAGGTVTDLTWITFVPGDSIVYDIIEDLYNNLLLAHTI